MNTDIRIALDLFGHPKIRALEKSLGEAAVLALIRLWTFTAGYAANGSLRGLDPGAISDAAGWSGDAQQFVDQLLSLRLLDSRRGSYAVHNWSVHQPWAVGAPQRSRQAREAAQTRWERRRLALSNGDAQRMRSAMRSACEEQCGQHADSNAPFLSFPILTEEGERTHARRRASPATKGKTKSTIPDGFTLSPELREYAKRCGCDPDGELDRFRADAIAENRLHANWGAAFQKWCLNEQKWRAERNGNGRRERPGPRIRTLEELRAEQEQRR